MPQQVDDVEQLTNDDYLIEPHREDADPKYIDNLIWLLRPPFHSQKNDQSTRENKYNAVGQNKYEAPRRAKRITVGTLLAVALEGVRVTA